MLAEEGAEEEGEVLDKVLLVVLPVLVGLTDVSGDGKHLRGFKSVMGYSATYMYTINCDEAASFTIRPSVLPISPPSHGDR